MDSSKGQLGMEILLVLVVLFVVALGFIMIAPMASEINQDIQDEEEFSDAAKSVSQSTVGDFSTRMDGVYFFLTILLWIFMIGAAFMSSTHPVFLVASIILLIFVIMLAAILGNDYNEMIQDPDFSEFAESYPKMNWIMDNILAMTIMMALSTIMVLYTRLQG